MGTAPREVAPRDPGGLSDTSERSRGQIRTAAPGELHGRAMDSVQASTRFRSCGGKCGFERICVRAGADTQSRLLFPEHLHGVHARSVHGRQKRSERSNSQHKKHDREKGFRIAR